MRQTLYSALSGLIAVSGYFLLVDFVRPALEERHFLILWWLTLGLYVALVFGYGCWSILRTRPGLVGTGFLLLATTAYLYDPSIEPHLASVRLEWLWIAPLGGSFFWIFAFVKNVRSRERQKSN
jgi:hypothetical protein